MTQQETGSSLHDDFLYPYHGQKLPAPEQEKISPADFANKLRQLGVTEQDLEKINISEPLSMNETEYNQLISQAVRRQYDVLFPSVFAWWSEITPKAQIDYIRHATSSYDKWGFNLTKKGGQLSTDHPNMILSLEGADFVSDMSDLQTISEVGIGSVMFQYNRPNALASNEGLTDLGWKGASYFLGKDIIIDLAHQGPNVRRDLFEVAKQTGKGNFLAYTHGSTVEDLEKSSDYNPDRGLTQRELKDLVDLGGIMALGISRPFFGSIQHIGERIDQILQLENGPQSLALGTDFGGISKEDEIGIGKREDVVILANLLSERFDCSDSQIGNILCDNARNWISDTTSDSIAELSGN